ncbi:precorrin-6A synthase (deacetylating) [Lamprobacter modestohalophilus]|uniref:precorrin-6A synthase (deacetylating) n=1 Tax=Lamprobacter modestohalophilus TaxID=1064514 RepID=UPI002ADEA7AA|nr:precorrin-6A synthase (deacetylating) [Lamprobacter modestohalophilus]MEA1051717.1 precorrin-6A synthase (deacetylating) [Lamprobacter modestohalophilus]
MKTLSLIGIGPGGPEYLTLQAIEAMRRVDVFFMLEKAGRGKEELLEIRHRIVDRYLEPGRYRVVTASSPPRSTAEGYRQGVAAWHAEKRALFVELFERELAEGQCGAFLIWGDPALYDQTVSLISVIVAAAPDRYALEVIPGITAVQALTAQHRIPLNRVGEAINLTTGRQMAHCDPSSVNNAFVMLDGEETFQRFTGQNMDIYWGAYLGTDDELLIAGSLDEVLDELLETRRRARERKGWIMDTYLLRRRPRDD